MTDNFLHWCSSHLFAINKLNPCSLICCTIKFYEIFKIIVIISNTQHRLVPANPLVHARQIQLQQPDQEEKPTGMLFFILGCV